MLMLLSLPRHTGAQTMVDMELEVHEHVSNKCAFDRAIITSNVNRFQKEGMLHTREDVLHKQRLHRCGGQKTAQCYRIACALLRSTKKT